MTFPMQGTRVTFPSKPYPSQMAMMNNILRGLNNRQNCLVESPTGSGKTLALLCSTLAWQKREIERCLEHQAVENAKIMTEKLKPAVPSVTNTPVSATAVKHEYIEDLDDMEDFKPMKKMPKVAKVTPKSTKTIDSIATKNPKITGSCTITKPSLVVVHKPNGEKQYLYIKDPCVLSQIPDSNQGVTIAVDVLNEAQQTAMQIAEGSGDGVAYQVHKTDQGLVQLEMDQTSFQMTSNSLLTTEMGQTSLIKNEQMNPTSFPLPEMNQTSFSKTETTPTSVPSTGMAQTSILKSETSSQNAIKCDPQTPPRPAIKNELQTPAAPSSRSGINSQFKTPFRNTEPAQTPTEEVVKGFQRYPKIYFGTRTHKQVSQIVRELSKTAYSNVKMCILSSREKACIHPLVSKQPNKNEGCKEAIDKNNCIYYGNSGNLTHDALRHHRKNRCGENYTWDMEDLVRVGKQFRACPYFGIRKLMIGANIIIGPYNYFIDPSIRQSMGLNLTDSILILDEAHNIEDASRDAASVSLSFETMSDAIKELEQNAQFSPHYDLMTRIIQIFSGICSFIHRNKDKLDQYREFDRGGRVFSGTELVALLNEVGAGESRLPMLNNFFAQLLEAKMQKDETGLVCPLTVTLISALLPVLGYLYKNQMQFVTDYRCVIVKVASKGRSNINGWRTKRKSVDGWSYDFNIWCLNPAVAFSDFKDTIHTLIVTSGTLSPLSTFQSELGLPFPNRLEANHVVKQSQVWVGTVGKSPSGVPLNGVYRSMDTFAFQDEIGALVLKVCRTVPHGVLCFFPSYSAMAKLSKRWQDTGIHRQLNDLKNVIEEPRGGDFDEAMREYYDAIRQGIGALFLAVCRGKASEGLDFSDNNARAVITIGIPFPNFKDIQIDLKKKYNNSKMAEKLLMSGNEWYETQGFRAINQALGRCIRHKNDWGALFIVDERFQTNNRYANYLSKWVRQNLIHYGNTEQALTSLEKFCGDNSNVEYMPFSSQTSNASETQPAFGTPTQMFPVFNFLGSTPVIPIVLVDDEDESGAVSPAIFD